MLHMYTHKDMKTQYTEYINRKVSIPKHFFLALFYINFAEYKQNAGSMNLSCCLHLQ